MAAARRDGHCIVSRVYGFMGWRCVVIRCSCDDGCRRIDARCASRCGFSVSAAQMLSAVAPDLFRFVDFRLYCLSGRILELDSYLVYVSFSTKYDAPLATRSAPNVSGGSWARPSPNCTIPRCRSASARTPTPASSAISIFYASVMVDPDSIPEPLNDGLAKSASGGDGLLAKPLIVARSQR